MKENRLHKASLKVLGYKFYEGKDLIESLEYDEDRHSFPSKVY